MTDVFLEPRVLNYTGDKYHLILLAMRWGRVLKGKGSPEPLPLLVEQAVRDIVEGKLTSEEIMAIKPAPAPAPVSEIPEVVSVAGDGAAGDGKAVLAPDDDEDEAKKKTKKKKKDD